MLHLVLTSLILDPVVYIVPALELKIVVLVLYNLSQKIAFLPCIRYAPMALQKQ
ncbi:hypothetical protein APH_0414 [Anaplasma phagocytophilum str. HZ]|uniref:Uncharacterized protein n=1 Tax=Anaplasma phagocytophilum (strain HZ) TaxID=212042 RepID=Q2GKT4_ANAPZ|nr:hypothetical protein APH_0414 [Anaplasma phagocytophilum str. HZ]